MKDRLGKRLVNSFLLIVLITVSLIDIAILSAFKINYQNNIQNELKKSLDISLDVYNRNYSDKNLEDLLIDDNDLYWNHTNAEVQILDLEGQVLMDSVGIIYDDPINTVDFLAAKNNDEKVFIGKNPKTKTSEMALTKPIRNEIGERIGYLRFISSMEDANYTIVKMAISLLALTIFVIIITTIMSLLLARTVVRPIKELTQVAKKMADGQYKVKANISVDDEIGQLGEVLNSMSEEILKKEELKNDFISSVSHELRTPLTSIKGWAVVLKDIENTDREVLLDGLNIIEKESDRLSKMVEDLLDFSRYISGRIGLEKEAFDIAKTCVDVAKQLGPRARSNKIEFLLELLEDKVITIGDENRIRQLLINIIDNAIKFTSTDGWVKFSTYIRDDNFYMIVSDNGLGIEQTDLNRVKEKFYKGKHSKSHSGIGLSISDEIAKLHNGSLDIFSEVNIGTTVKIRIPLRGEEE